MKDFTTPEYINPIIEEIKERYTPDFTPAALYYLDCIVILKKNGSREGILIQKPGKYNTFRYSDIRRSPALYKVYAELDAYTAAAETEPGELFKWELREIDRIQEAIQAALIKEYSNPWRHTDTRAETLKMLYSLPGYAAAKLDTKNFIYDALNSKMRALQNA